MKQFKFIYGPVESWRMGRSLGIDPLSDSVKVCNLNCVYCQLGDTAILTNERKEYVPAQLIVDELARFFLEADPFLTENIDYLTFSGRGEPTLASNLSAMIRGARGIRSEEIAVITNATLMHLPEVREALSLADLVIAKLDAYDESSFFRVDKAIRGISFEQTLEGIKYFRDNYEGKLAIQIMFVEENRCQARQIAEIVRDINPDEIQINTPLRPSAARPLDKVGIEEIKFHFRGMPALSVYEHDRKETVPFNIQETIKRHGNFRKI